MARDHKLLHCFHSFSWICFLHAQLDETFLEDLGIARSFQSKDKSERLNGIFKHKQHSPEKKKNKYNLIWCKAYSKASIDSQSPNGDLGLAIT